MGCCSPVQRRSCPWINDCCLIPSCIRSEWAKSDYYQAQAEMAFRRQIEWERSFEGQEATRKMKERQREDETRRYNELMASRGPEWRREQDENFRHQQLLNAIYNVGRR